MLKTGIRNYKTFLRNKELSSERMDKLAMISPKKQTQGWYLSILDYDYDCKLLQDNSTKSYRLKYMRTVKKIGNYLRLIKALIAVGKNELMTSEKNIPAGGIKRTQEKN